MIHSTTQEDKMEITITRQKLNRSRFATGPGTAWKWLYYSDAVACDGKTKIGGHDSLRWITSIIKCEYPKAKILKGWN